MVALSVGGTVIRNSKGVVEDRIVEEVEDRQRDRMVAQADVVKDDGDP